MSPFFVSSLELIRTSLSQVFLRKQSRRQSRHRSLSGIGETETLERRVLMTADLNYQIADDATFDKPGENTTPFAQRTLITDAEGDRTLREAYTLNESIGGITPRIQLYGSAGIVNSSIGRSASLLAFNVNAGSSFNAVTRTANANGQLFAHYLAALDVSLPSINFDPFVANGATYETVGTVSIPQATSNVTNLAAYRTFGSISHVQVRQGTNTLGQATTEYVFAGVVTQRGSHTLTADYQIRSFSIVASISSSHTTFHRANFYSEETVPFITVEDATAPILSSIAPLDNVSGVPRNGDIVLGFNETVAKGTGNILIKNSNDNSVFQAIDVKSANVVIAGNTVTIRHNNFTPGVGYYVEVPDTTILDLAGNNFIGIVGPTLWNFTATQDASAPILTSIAPLDDMTGVPRNADIVMGFNEPVAKGTGCILIKKAGDNSLFQAVDVNSSNVVFSGSTVTIRHNLFATSTAYYVEVPDTTIQDLAGNSFIGIVGPTLWNFTTTPDGIAPLLMSISPSDNATGVPVNADIMMGFNEPVTKGAGVILRIRKSADNSVVEMIDVNSSNVIFSGNTVTIRHSKFAPSTSYYLEVPNTAIQDLAGNNFIGIVGPTLWNFTTTADGTAPVLTSISPLDDATEVPVNVDIVLGFSEPVAKGAGNILIKKASDNSVFQEIDVKSPNIVISGNTVTIRHNDFAKSTGYYLEIPNTVIQDVAGNSFIGIVGPTLWNFTTTVDGTAPVLTSISPLDDATGVPVNVDIVLGFSEPVAKGTGNIVIRKTGDDSVFQTIDVKSSSVVIFGNTVTIRHNNFAASTGYYLEIPNTVIQDLGGNSFIGIVGPTLWNFTTFADGVAPVLWSISPLDNATEVPVNADLVLGFNESVIKGTGNILIKKTSDNSIFQTIPVSSANVVISGSTVTIKHNMFNALTDYYVDVPNTAILDLGGNAFIGIAGATLWNFVTA